VIKQLKFRKTALALAVTSLYAGAAAAQLDEVLVTATKRVESTQDIPMSVQAISGEKLDAMGIDNLGDLSASVPNFTVGDTLTVSQITMRGVGSGEDRGFETPISTFKDGVYMPRSRQTRSPFFDVARVEVVRGPQAVLFGLNSTAGAIAIHGAVNQPGDEFELTLTGEYEVEYDGYRGRLVAGGSLGQSLGWRVALESGDTGDGWLENHNASDAGALESDIARVSLVWAPTDTLTATLRWEHNEAEVDGQTTELVNGELDLPGDFAGGAPGGLFSRVAQSEALGAALGYAPLDIAGEDSKFDYEGWHREDQNYQALAKPIYVYDNYRSDPGADQTIDNVSLNVEWQLGEYTLSSVLGYSDYDYDASVNIAGLAENVFYGTNYEEYEQTSIEVRLASPLGQTVEWIVGMYYHDGTLKTDQPNVVDLGLLFGYSLGLPAGLVEDEEFDGARFTELGGAILDQDTELMSPFLSATWNISDTLRLTGGVRYSDEDKDYDRNAATPGSQVYLTNPDGSLGPGLGFALFNATGAAVGKTSGSLNSSNTMPEALVEWDVSDDIMLFARYAESAKSGGVATAGSTAASGLIYDDETATSYEIGMKGRFFDGLAELNVVAFTTEYDDLQVKSSVVTTTGVNTIIGNAGKATSEGIEIDGRIAATDWMTLGGTLAWLDASYDENDNVPCNRSRSTKPGTVEGTCDLSGEDLPFAAEYAGSVYADFVVPIGGNLNFVANATISFSDDYAVEGTLEPTLFQDSWTRLSGRVGVEAADAKWSVTVIGQNLTEEEVWAGGQPLFGYDMVYPTMPRTVTLQGIYRF
jgi:outer membrane receptor protein involved in Fe transport